MRACNTCHEIKSLDQFHRSPTGQDGRSAKCAACSQAYQSAYRARRRQEERDEFAAEPVEPVTIRRAERPRGLAITAETIERQIRSQELALLGAGLARLRKALNAWWEESRGGEEVECGPALLAARVALRAAADEDGKVIRRRRRA